jgi:Ca2+-binding RTX toxin-like protein
MAITNWTYVINFSHAPVINEGDQTGNYQIWGLGYARLIIGSQGSNVIVADGSCPPGSTVTAYCSVAPMHGSRNTVIYANGAGPNTIYAGEGPSVIFGGTGPNTINSAPTSSLIVGGNGGDTINANQGATVVYAGTGTNTIYALSPAGDTVYCSGQHDTVYAYQFDHIYNCANVIYKPAPGGPNPHHRWRYHAPSLRHDPTARRFYARLKAAEKKARR